MFTKSLVGTRIPKVVLPKYKDWGDILQMAGTGKCAGSFSFYSRSVSIEKRRRRSNRMFAGEGGPERTNKRFHYVSRWISLQKDYQQHLTV